MEQSNRSNFSCLVILYSLSFCSMFIIEWDDVTCVTVSFVTYSEVGLLFNLNLVSDMHIAVCLLFYIG